MKILPNHNCTKIGTAMTPRQIGELEMRDFLGDDTWKRWKLRYDECMSFRKTIKGKPTGQQKLALLSNNCELEFLGSWLFHSMQLAKKDQCGCTKCGQKRTGSKSMIDTFSEQLHAIMTDEKITWIE